MPAVEFGAICDCGLLGPNCGSSWETRVHHGQMKHCRFDTQGQKRNAWLERGAHEDNCCDHSQKTFFVFRSEIVSALPWKGSVEHLKMTPATSEQARPNLSVQTMKTQANRMACANKTACMVFHLKHSAKMWILRSIWIFQSMQAVGHWAFPVDCFESALGLFVLSLTTPFCVLNQNASLIHSQTGHC